MGDGSPSIPNTIEYESPVTNITLRLSVLATITEPGDCNGNTTDCRIAFSTAATFNTGMSIDHADR
jgi:hypothetical protein